VLPGPLPLRYSTGGAGLDPQAEISHLGRHIGLLSDHFAALAIFVSSKIVMSSRSRRIIRGSSCGYWDRGSSQDLASFERKLLNDSYIASSYAKDCYSAHANKINCRTFPVPKIDWASNKKVPCPFAEGVCLQPTSSFQMDTSLLDSQTNFGINCRLKERIKYRSVDMCTLAHRRNFHEEHFCH
jgi:hypothetical protein